MRVAVIARVGVRVAVGPPGVGVRVAVMARVGVRVGVFVAVEPLGVGVRVGVTELANVGVAVGPEIMYSIWSNGALAGEVL